MKNAFLKDFRTQVRDRFAEDSEQMSYTDWILKNTTLRKKPFSFQGYEFQKQIVDDMSPTMHVIKCSQIGLTEVQLRKFAAFLKRNTGVNGIFTLPKDDMYKRVSQTRFKPMIDNDKVFNMGGNERQIRSIQLYQIDQSFGYFVGNTEGDATSINADLLFHDEVDLSNQEMLALFQSRLQGSDWRITQNFSTPTFEGFGIDAGYRISDQHEYMVRCQKCGHHNIPEFTPASVHLSGISSDLNDYIEIDNEMYDGIDFDKSYIFCQSCHHQLVMNDHTLWQWVPRYQSRRIRGYRVSPFCTPRLTLQYIIEQMLNYKRNDATRRFYNTVLGQAYNDSNARLSELDIRAVMQGMGDPEIPTGTPMMVGIDVGLTCHVVLYRVDTPTPVAVSFRQVLADHLVGEVEKLFERYNIVGGCMDRNPYSTLANEIRDRTDSIIMPVEYATTPTAAPINFLKDELDVVTHVRANRTGLLDSFAMMVRKRKTAFYGYGHHENLLVQHLRDMVRIEQEDLPATWQKLTGNDHFFHAAALGLFAGKVHEAWIYRNTEVTQQIMATQGLTATLQTSQGLSFQNRRKAPLPLAVTG